MRVAVEALIEAAKEKRRGTSISLGAGAGVRGKQRLAISLTAKMAGGEVRGKGERAGEEKEGGEER